MQLILMIVCMFYDTKIARFDILENPFVLDYRSICSNVQKQMIEFKPFLTTIKIKMLIETNIKMQMGSSQYSLFFQTDILNGTKLYYTHMYHMSSAFLLKVSLGLNLKKKSKLILIKGLSLGLNLRFRQMYIVREH